MKMPKVDNFCGCMELRTGGLVIALFHAALSVFGFLLGIAALLVLFLYDCRGYSNHGPIMIYIVSGFCDPFKGILIPVAIVIMLFSISLFVLSYFCIRGILQRNHSYVRPMMVLMGVLMVSSLLEVFSMELVLIILALLITFLYGYQLVVLYSIHSQYENEYMSTGFTATQSSTY